MFKAFPACPFLRIRQCTRVEFQTLPVPNTFIGSDLSTLKMFTVIAVCIDQLAFNGFLSLTSLFALNMGKTLESTPVRVRDGFSASFNRF